MSRSGTLAPSVQSDRLWSWLVEAGPLASIVLVLWVKLIYIGLLLPSISWAGGEPLHLFAALRSFPDMFTATLACLLLPVPLLILLPRVPRAAVALLLDFALTFLAVGDLIHVRFYADVTSVSGLAQTSMLTWVVDSILTLLDPSDLRYFADLPVGMVGLVLYARWCKQTPAVSLTGRMRLGLAPLVLAVALALPTTRLASSDSAGIACASSISNTTRLPSA